VHVTIVRVVDQHVALQHVALLVGRQRIEQRGPGADVAPARIERQHDRIPGLLHDRVVDRLAAAFLERRLVDAHEIQIRRRGENAACTASRDIRRKVLQLGEIARRREHEHAAVPIIIAGLDELRAQDRAAAFSMNSATGKAGPARRRGGCSHSRSRARARRCRRSRACRIAPPPRRARPPAETRAHRGSRDRPAPRSGSPRDRFAAPLQSAASATAGAVLRPVGSSRIAAGAAPSTRICSATANRCASLHTTIGALARAMPASAQRGLLQHRALAGEREQLLRIHLARQRPEPSARAARQNHRNQ
jgi:hypothetical protein